MKHILCIIVVLPMLVVSCSEPSGDAPAPTERYVYVPVADSTGAERDPGLYRIALSDGAMVRIDSRQVCAVSGVAENGIVLFRVGTGGPATGSAQLLYGRCEDGSIIPVPFPVSSDLNVEYAYALPPEVSLAAQGHHAVYPVLYRPVGSAREADAQLRLARFNCAKGEMTIIDAHTFAREAMASAGVTHARAAEGQLAIARDGSAVYFVLEGRREEAGVSVPVAWALVEWTSKALRLVDSVRGVPERLVGYSEALRTVTVEQDGAMHSLSVTGALEHGIPRAGALELRRFPVTPGVFAAWGDAGLELRDAWSGLLYERVYSYAALEAQFGSYAFEETSPLTISADGEWLAFALRRTVSASLFDIFAIARDGSQVKRLRQNVAAGAPVISNPLVK